MSRKRPKARNEARDSPESKIEEKEDREEYDAFGFMKNKKESAAVAGVFFLIGFAIAWFITPQMTAQVIGSGVQVSSDDVGESTISYINDNLLIEGYEATLVGVEEENGLYQVSVDVKQDGSDDAQNVNFFVSGDGELLFFNEPVDMTEEIVVEEETEEAEDTGVTKSDVPVANVFVMSYCPYGLQMQKAVIPVMELLGDKADININYVHYIMHGKDEIDENNNQYCIQREEPDKFAAYLRCFVQSDDSEGCMEEAGIDTAGIGSCIAEIDEQFNITGLYEDQSTWSNGRYPPYLVDYALASQYGVGGSPTFVLNGQTVSVSRSPEAVKQAICSAFDDPPEECGQTLSTTQAAAGIGEMEDTSGTASTASCG